MSKFKTPGVYIQEKSAFPNSVVEVPTAIPAFVGYTQTASYNNKSLNKKPVRISSMDEFHKYFGYGAIPEFDLAETFEGALSHIQFEDTEYRLSQVGKRFCLYQSMQMFYLNGGGPCYVVSVGNYSDAIEKDDMLEGIKTLVKEQEPTLLVTPDAMSLTAADCYAVQEHMIVHCGSIMRSRFAILDIHNGFQNQTNTVEAFRSGVSNEIGGAFAAAYYPWLNATLLRDSEVSYANLTRAGKTVLKTIVNEELSDSDADFRAIIDAIDSDSENPEAEIDETLRASSAHYRTVFKEITRQLNILPPSSTIAGLYSMTDNEHGVWKAPANLSISEVAGSTCSISHGEQEILNADLNGKSVNAIRTFAGEGTLVWGARTLDGNSLDWRYINVRRTMIMLEQSIKLAASAYVFEANDAQTWATVKSMISNFLVGIWKQGALAGAAPEEAFSVQIGLGETMTADDVSGGRMRITVLVAITRPAEFVEITLEQKMHQS